MHSQKGHKPIYGSFNNREEIDTVITKAGIQLSFKVPHNIGFPSLSRDGKKEKTFSSKPQSRGTGKKQINYSGSTIKSKNPSITSQESNTIISCTNRGVSSTNTSITINNQSTSHPSTQPSTHRQPLKDNKNSITVNKQSSIPSSRNFIENSSQKYDVTKSKPNLNDNKLTTNKNPHTIINNGFPPLGNSTTNDGKPQSNNIPNNINNISSISSVSSANSVSKDSNSAVDGNPSNLKSANNSKSSIKSWADLLKTYQDPTTITVTNSSKPTVTKQPTLSNKNEKPAQSLQNGKSNVGGLVGVLSNYELSLHRVEMQPRGLVNLNNTCFMNAILQTLFHCPPFYNLLARIGKEVAHSFKSKTPLVDSLVMFINEYRQSKNNETEFGEPILPDYVYNALRSLKKFEKGRHQDAEEFLGYLLDGLHEEFLTVFKPGGESKNAYSNQILNGQADSKGDGSEEPWMETDVEESPISHIFCGHFRSVLRKGSNDSITLEPYQSLKLDIQRDDVKTIGDALKNFTMPEEVDDLHLSKKGLVRVTKQVYFEKLPPVLTLHLKRFLYDMGGTQKLNKHISYSTTLSIPPELMAPSRKSNVAIEYQLFGVVYHHGNSAGGGHYTVDVLRHDNEWIHIDDSTISPISEGEVSVDGSSNQSSDRSAYILFYMRKN
ncbi:8878_t:CDS:10 [Diversispora eburnea]|uniref:ubiquitinyl hydrolase 1 n=1 Tax=Diversispora eburnea TaxID=1213867 RepID=A0A9N8V1E8_9GLOM|nr:8878_t:CDS:10 [Diversispora eburnea]